MFKRYNISRRSDIMQQLIPNNTTIISNKEVPNFRITQLQTKIHNRKASMKDTNINKLLKICIYKLTTKSIEYLIHETSSFIIIQVINIYYF